MQELNVRKDCDMLFKENDIVLATAKVLRKNPKTGEAETLSFINEKGTVKKARTHKASPEKNTYWIETQYGISILNGKKLITKPA